MMTRAAARAAAFSDQIRDDLYITSAEVCELLHICPMTLYRMVKRGDLPPADLRSGRVVRWRLGTIRRLASQRPEK